MNKTVLITGATSGLGLSYAKYYASEGFDLIITGRRADVIAANAAMLRSQYRVDVKVILTELSDLEGINYLFSQIKGSEIEVLINNAGFGLKPYFAETPESDIEAMLCLQIWCTTKLIRFALDGMSRRNSGTIINISSDGAFAVMPHNVLYSSAKLYLLNLTEGLHMELTDTNIKVQAVCPGFIDSHFHENAGMKIDKSKKGIFGFQKPDDVVARAMKDLEKGRIVSVPDKGAKIIRGLAKVLPRSVFYKVSISFAARISGKK